MSDADQHDAIDAFAQAAVAAGQVWGLEHDEGWAIAGSESEDDLEVMPFWSSEAAARACATDEWTDYRVSAIPLDSFIEQWLPGMHEDGFLVGLDWDSAMEGAEVEPDDLAETFEDLLGGAEDEDDDGEEE